MLNTVKTVLGNATICKVEFDSGELSYKLSSVYETEESCIIIMYNNNGSVFAIKEI